MTIDELASSVKKEIRMRIPEWCENYSLAVNGEAINQPNLDKGYAVLERQWKQGDVITLNIEMPAVLKQADPRVKQDVGKRAIQRGPLVYCMEETDNPTDFDQLTLSTKSALESQFDATLLDGIVKITAKDEDKTINLIPYYAWDNREAGKMKVWIDYQE